MQKRTFLLAAVLAGSTAALAATFLPARLAVDVNTVPIPASPGLLPVCRGAGFADFTGSADERTQSIWRTDATPAGTRKLADLGTTTDPVAVECLAIHGALTYFQYLGSDGVGELWRTDGTAAGTLRLIRQPNGDAGPVRFAGTLTNPVFIASINGRGNELVTTDGTTQGTRVVADIVVGSDGPNFGNGFAALGGRLYFSVNMELWSTDGTESGTARITSLERTPDPFAVIIEVQAFDGALFALVAEGDGWTIWRSNGTATGTTTVYTGIAAADGFLGGSLQRAPNGLLLFNTFGQGTGDGALWRTDGTTAGTVVISATEPDLTPIFGLQPLADGRFVFVGRTQRYGNELWITDGTDSGTRLVIDLEPGDGGSNILLWPTPIGNGLMFSAINSDSPSRAPWFTDGTAAGTFHLATLDTRLDTSNIGVSDPTMLGQNAFFWTKPIGFTGEVQPATLWRFNPANRSVGAAAELSSIGITPTPEALNGRLLFLNEDPQLGRELWASDGSQSGTRLVADLAPQTANGDASPGRLLALGDAVLFAATDGIRARGLWRTDGTTAGTVRISDGAPSDRSGFPTPEAARLGNRIVYSGEATPNDHEVWVTDGTTAGTARLTDLTRADSFVSGGFVDAAPGGCGKGFLELNGRVFFGATVGRIGRLYRTDGSASGTVELGEFPFSPSRLFNQSSRVCVLSSLSDWVFFAASVSVDAGEFLWRSNDAGGNAERVRSAAGRPLAAPIEIARVGTALWFYTGDGLQRGWWRISAATANAELVVEDTTNVGLQRVVAAVGPLLYFEACNGNGLCNLSRTDGTTAGTFALAPAIISASLGGKPPTGVLGERVLFQSATDGELWITDGTAAGTRQLRDILPGAQRSEPTQFVDFRGLTYFIVKIDNGVTTTVELWRTDGTTANTERTNALPVQSAEFNTVSYPFGMLAAGNRLFLPLYTVANGQELWNVENLAPVARADSATTPAGANVSVDVLANDADEDGLLNRGSVRIAQAPASGTTQIDPATGAVGYSPPAGFSGTVTFSYAVSDNQQRESAPAIVTVTVNAPPPPPAPPPSGGGGAWDWLSLLMLAGCVAGSLLRIKWSPCTRRPKGHSYRALTASASASQIRSARDMSSVAHSSP